MLSFEEQKKILETILRRNTNKHCADCGSHTPTCNCIFEFRGLIGFRSVCVLELFGSPSRLGSDCHSHQVDQSGSMESRMGREYENR